MVRKIATQVPATVSRLVESSLIRTPPPWYGPVLANPPPVLPARQTTPRSRPGATGYTDLPENYTAGASTANAHSDPSVGHHKTKFLRQPKLRPAPIVYPADRIRRQFFTDFPFEALRPVSLVEATEVAKEHPVKGKQWTALAQRGAYPTVEDTVEFTLNLHETAGLPLSAAYAQATDEFVALRAQHEVATLAAAAEARAYGATFKRDEWTRTFDIEQRALDERWKADNAGTVTGPLGPRYRKPKMWSGSVKPERVPAGEFTAGREYVQRWRLPAPVQAAAPAEGDLVSAIGSAAPSSAGAKEQDVDDIELMNAILGAPTNAPNATA